MATAKRKLFWSTVTAVIVAHIFIAIIVGLVAIFFKPNTP